MSEEQECVIQTEASEILIKVCHYYFKANFPSLILNSPSLLKNLRLVIYSLIGFCKVTWVTSCLVIQEKICFLYQRLISWGFKGPDKPQFSFSFCCLLADKDISSQLVLQHHAWCLMLCSLPWWSWSLTLWNHGLQITYFILFFVCFVTAIEKYSRHPSLNTKGICNWYVLSRESQLIVKNVIGHVNPNPWQTPFPKVVVQHKMDSILFACFFLSTLFNVHFLFYLGFFLVYWILWGFFESYLLCFCSFSFERGRTGMWVGREVSGLWKY